MREVSFAVLVSLCHAASGSGAFAQELKAVNASSTLATVGAQMTDAPSSLAATATLTAIPGQLNLDSMGLSSGLATPGQIALGSMKAAPAMKATSSDNATPSSAASASSANIAAIASIEPQAMSSMAGIDIASTSTGQMSELTSGLTVPALRR